MGCTSESGGDGPAAGESKKEPSPSTGASASASAAGDDPYTLAEDRAPGTRREAVAFVRELDVRPDYFGAGYRKREPFESDPAEWAVLGEDCLWRREPLAGTALASLTRSFELPEQGGKGPVYVSVTVTVHEDVAAARRDMAGALESALRCPEQRLNATDVVSGLFSRVDAYTDARSVVAEDDLAEVGEWRADGAAKGHPFDWYKYRVGPVTVAGTARHGAGRTEDEDNAVSSDLAQGVGFVAADIDRWGTER
ncbi:hypothetical protein ACIPSE_24340 [Streptomyces sp. NPDC090106]|uniref:hypothetical protein n=1 Tax=Streptomyces sp. NPDC090106 TaxID=3365946 RepID=UPI00381E6AF5